MLWLVVVPTRVTATEVSAERPAAINSSAIIASDPHLGLNLPNTWILAGLKSPSYHAVGMMVPGLPVFAIGRNADIASSASATATILAPSGISSPVRLSG